MMKIKKMIIFMYVYIYRCHFGTQFLNAMDERKQNRAGYKQRLRCARQKGEQTATGEIKQERYNTQYDINLEVKNLSCLRETAKNLKNDIRKLDADALDETEKMWLKDNLRSTTNALREKEEEFEQLQKELRALVEGTEDSYPECPVCFDPAKCVRECGHMFCVSCKADGRRKCAVCMMEKSFTQTQVIQ